MARGRARALEIYADARAQAIERVAKAIEKVLKLNLIFAELLMECRSGRSLGHVSLSVSLQLCMSDRCVVVTDGSDDLSIWRRQLQYPCIHRFDVTSVHWEQ